MQLAIDTGMVLPSRVAARARRNPFGERPMLHEVYLDYVDEKGGRDKGGDAEAHSNEGEKLWSGIHVRL